jgi:hypothetical protein
VADSTFSENVGLAVYEDDRSDEFGVVNAVRYRANRVHGTTFGNRVFRNKVSSPFGMSVTELNQLVVDRGNGNTTTKAPAGDNVFLSAPPVVGAALTAPSRIIPATAAGDPWVATRSYLGVAWGGGSATLDGQGVTGHWGLLAASLGPHTLEVDGEEFVATTQVGALPSAQLTASPAQVPAGGSSSLQWSTLEGRFVDAVLDWGLSTGGQVAGALTVWPPDTREHTLVVVTEEGGAADRATVTVGGTPPPELFADGFESGGTGQWGAALP